MSIYDRIGSEYDNYRTEIGAEDVLSVAQQMGDGLDVLDLGCGTGYPIAVRIAPRASRYLGGTASGWRRWNRPVRIAPRASRYLGIDNSEAMLAAFRRNVPRAECACLDMKVIEVLGRGWDLIFSWGAICHLPIEAQARTLIAAATMLNPAGRLLFTGGEDPGQCKGSVGPYSNVIDHYSLGRIGYADLLTANGLRALAAEPGGADNFIYLFEKPQVSG